VEWGDVLTASATSTSTIVGDTVSLLKKVSKAYDDSIIGVASNPADSGDFNTIGYNISTSTHQNPVALKGRVKVKISGENGSVKAGDHLTSSALYPGYAMKAVRSGQIIGRALEDWTAESETSKSSVMTFINVAWQNINNQFVLGDDQLAGNAEGGVTNAPDSSFLINQKGSGAILQLQSNGQDRFMVATTGSISILAGVSDGTNSIFAVKNNSEEVFNLNARGDVSMNGVIIAKDDSFAGSIATNASGLAEINFTYDLGTGKPVVELTPESESPVFAQVASWKKDGSGNYTGFTIKTFGINGTPASSVVHYTVTGKGSGYDTNGQIVNIPVAPAPGGGTGGVVVPPPVSGGGVVAGEATSTPAVTPVDTATTTPATETPTVTTTETVAPVTTDTTTVTEPVPVTTPVDTTNTSATVEITPPTETVVTP
jgi:hypothetical protein